MNLLFYIYVPQATGLKNTRQSTWMNPIIDGVEAKKLLGKFIIFSLQSGGRCDTASCVIHVLTAHQYILKK